MSKAPPSGDSPPPKAEATLPEAPPRHYLPNSFRFLVDRGEEGATIEGTLYAVPHGQGHLIDVEGTVMTLPSGILPFDSIKELAQKSGWSKEEMDVVMKRLQALPTAR